MILNETGFSDVHPSLEKELLCVAYGSDNRPAWVGSRRPQTLNPEMQAMAQWAAAHYAFYLNFVRDYLEPDGLVLDIGCGAGQNTAMLARYCEEAVGIDSDRKAIDFARKYNADRASFHCLRFPETLPAKWIRPFDTVFLIETIEHVPHQEQFDFLGAALSRLGEKGLLFLTTPNEEISSPPHVGIWSAGWMNKIEEHFPTNIVRSGFFSNAEPGLGFTQNASTHRALVMKR